MSPEFRPEYYLPVGLFVTAYARKHIISYAQKNYDSFIYCDTDSLHLKEKSDNIPLDNEKLGYFKIEKNLIEQDISERNDTLEKKTVSY